MANQLLNRYLGLWQRAVDHDGDDRWDWAAWERDMRALMLDTREHLRAASAKPSRKTESGT